MKSLTLIASLAACTPADWSKKDQAMESAEVVLLATDWGQTVQDVVPSCSEGNPIIGGCGERLGPNIYFPLVVTTTLVLSRLIPAYYRSTFQGAMIGAEAATIWDNWIAWPRD